MIDTPIFFFYIETMHNLLIFARFQSIFSMTVTECGILTMIDTPMLSSI